jgi:3'(2'), 5'-bisphosphate nucleotidase
VDYLNVLLERYMLCSFNIRRGANIGKTIRMRYTARVADEFARPVLIQYDLPKTTMPADYQSELAIALAAVRDASSICSHVQASISADVLEKQDRSPVTIADFASQAIVCRGLGDAFPDDPIIAEEDSWFLRQPENAQFLESVRREVSNIVPDVRTEQVLDWIDRGGAKESSARFWTLDPIDGTKGFLRGEQYAVSLALIVDGHIQLGVLGCPNLPADSLTQGPAGALFSAVRGQGAEVRSLPNVDLPAQRLSTSDTQATSEARMCESVEAGHSSHGHSHQISLALAMTADPVRLDSQAKYAVVARGEADMYLRLPTRKDYREKIWDHAGGVLVVQEAGGRVTDVHGRDLEFTHGHELLVNEGVIVTNGILHETVLSAVQDVLGTE